MTGITRNISKLTAYIDTPQPDPQSSGLAWEIIAKADSGTEDQGVIGVVFAQKKPVDQLYWRLIDESIWSRLGEIYNPETIATLIWLTELTESSLRAGILTSPSPSHIIYTYPYEISYDDPHLALDSLWANKTNFFRPRNEKTTARGGDRPTMDNATAEQMVLQQLQARFAELAARSVKPRRRADDFGPPVNDPHHIAAIAAATGDIPYDNDQQISAVALDIASSRRNQQAAAICILTPNIQTLNDNAREAYEEMLNRIHIRLQRLDIQSIESDSPAELADRLAKFLST